MYYKQVFISILLRYLSYRPLAEPVSFWGLGNCVIPDQVIQNGYGKYTEAKYIEIGDNVITHEGILKPVLNVTTREMNDNEWTPEIELYSIPFTNITTDNHPYYAVKKKGYCKDGRQIFK